MKDGSNPVTWCTNQINVVINDSDAPVGARADLEAALRKISGLSGISFNIVGESNMIPSSTYHLTPGDPYPPVLIAWTTPERSDLLTGKSSAAAVANPVDNGDGVRYVTGSVAINVDHDVLYRSGFGEGMTRGNLYLHELGHVLGLAHVDSDDELMHAIVSSESPNGFAAGDRRGILALRC
jgi:hypothetical protein